MVRVRFIVTGTALLLAACGQTDHGAANQSTVKSAEPPKKSAYCFFKDDEMKDWKASRDPDGSIRIAGKAHVKDPRYMASVGQVAVGPKKVIMSPTITTNDTGYAKPDDWWDVSVVVPNTASLNEVAVQCGGKVVANLEVAPKS